ncbi:hypothetical protein BH24CHL6_BH24CHL6_10060 [soil metagenome]
MDERLSGTSRRRELLEATAWLVGRLAIVFVAGVAGLVVVLVIAQLNGPFANPPQAGTVVASGSPAPTPAVGITPLPAPSTSAQGTRRPPSQTSAAAASPGPEATPTVHIVAPGDTIREIARRYGVAAQEIVALNQLQDRNLIMVGERLLIPAPEE